MTTKQAVKELKDCGYTVGAFGFMGTPILFCVEREDESIKLLPEEIVDFVMELKA